MLLTVIFFQKESYAHAPKILTLMNLDNFIPLRTSTVYMEISSFRAVEKWEGSRVPFSVAIFFFQVKSENIKKNMQKASEYYVRL